jgi:hypothetical protein
VDALATVPRFQRLVVTKQRVGTTDRLADTFEFFVPGHKAFEAGAKFLLARGYR